MLIVGAMVFACFVLPRSGPVKRTTGKKEDGFCSFLVRKDLLSPIACGATGLLMFQPIFNFLPYRLAGAPFHFSTEMITLTYFVYALGVFQGLLGVCAGFFTIPVVAIGLLNSKLSGGQGKANALYLLFYYCDGWLGITGAGFCFQKFGWGGVLGFVLCFLVVPLVTGLIEKQKP